jgi:pyruvate/2-oxoglutarate dehydrogenase complex dihydrolipoamide dehydrogenase (E3) component
MTSYDLLVYGLTPNGITAAVRAAREGLNVLLTGHARRLGGMMANGLVQWDMLSTAAR